MALRTILKKDTDEESLRKKSRPVTVFDQRLHNMIDDMVDTLKDSGGVGLAAPQVGILRRIVVIEKEDGTILELVNPEIIDTQGEQEGLEVQPRQGADGGGLPEPARYLGHCQAPHDRYRKGHGSERQRVHRYRFRTDRPLLCP